MHLRLDCYMLMSHPQEYMKANGITYQHATPQSMGDQWWFWNCEGAPDILPAGLSRMAIDPMDAIGFGLTKEKAEEIKKGGE